MLTQDKFLGELVEEMSLQIAATEATQAAAKITAATALQVSKDQYIRLNADFDNFRRRSVRPQPICMHSQHVLSACRFCRQTPCFVMSCKSPVLMTITTPLLLRISAYLGSEHFSVRLAALHILTQAGANCREARVIDVDV